MASKQSIQKRAAREVPPLTIVGGVPAKPIGTRGEAALAYEVRWHPPLY